MANLLERTGRVVFLRAHDVGTKFGPPNDQLDVEAVFCLNAIADGAFGFQLRNDGNLPARQAMFSLLRDAYVNNLPVTADFLIDPGKKNGTAIRIALIRNPGAAAPAVEAVEETITGKVRPAPSDEEEADHAGATDPKKAKGRKGR